MSTPPVLNLTWITDALAVGGRYPMEAAAHLARELGIRHVVDLRVEDCDDEAVLRSHGIELLHLPTEDVCAVTQARLADGVRWVGERLDRGEKVYVHCEHGIGRSALLALCLLVSRGAAPLEAMEQAKSRRERVSPSPAQLDAFLAFCAAWKEATGAGWALPSPEQLGRIAYRHLAHGGQAADLTAASTAGHPPPGEAGG